MESEEIFQVFIFGIKVIILGEANLKVMKVDVLAVFGMIHINGVKN